MTCWRVVATGTQRSSNPDIGRLSRRRWPILVSVVFVSLGTAYVFRWGSVVQGRPSSWVTPNDLWVTFGASVAFTHGHFGAIYAKPGFLAFPGILILLAPI